MPLVTGYLLIGCAIGLVEYLIAVYAFRNHPFRDAMSKQDMFLNCLIKNAIAWPVILFWLGMIALLKIYIFFRRK